jgi:glycine cleavage system pyridoxal-binding protein P
MHYLKITGIVIASCVLVAAAFLLWDEHTHAMRFAQGFQVGDESQPQHVLIATQGSPFKDALVAAVVEHLKSRAIYVKVIDVSALPTVHENDWTAVVLIHTWELGRAQADARTFSDHMRNKKKLIVVTTSGGGREKMPGIDAISAASVMNDVPARAAEVTAGLDALLAQQASQ